VLAFGQSIEETTPNKTSMAMTETWTDGMLL
jgi:hypothetical protein